MDKNRFSQWHETKKIQEKGIFYLLKFYKPDSNEIRNEVSWLTNGMLKNRDTFTTPLVKYASFDKGLVKMEFVEQNIKKEPSKEELIEYLTRCASELHSIIKSKEPVTRVPTSASEYNNYVKKFVEVRLDTIRSEFEIEKDLEFWILNKISKLHTEFFSIVHRDLRFRHLLLNEEKPVLIDWEYTNISEPAQDLAKLIYDSVINHDVKIEISMKKVLQTYHLLQKESLEQIEQKVRTFLPIIPLEHCAAFIKRKPEGYQKEVLKDLAFIYGLYYEEK